MKFDILIAWQEMRAGSEAQRDVVDEDLLGPCFPSRIELG